jgi:hypothetical protein
MLNHSSLKEYFLFTQHSLATFDSCPLKFRKRYLESLKWDSFPDENIKRRLEMGNNFHLLAHRYFMGIDPGLDKSVEECDELKNWMENLKKYFTLNTVATFLPEYKLRMAKGIQRLEANFDLLMIRDENIEIWDWKTHGENNKNKRRMTGKKLEESLQTKVYLYVLKEQSALILGEDIPCSRISMHYWQPDPPGTLVDINYDEVMHVEFGQILENKINNILNYDYADFDKAQYIKHCKFCEFNWFCNNDRVDFRAMEECEEFLDELDWDVIEEKF